MNIENGRADHISDVLVRMYPYTWFTWSSKERLYEHLGLQPKVWIDKDTLVDNPNELPSEEYLEAELKKMQDAFDAQQYARDRQSEYPSIRDQLDYIYHNSITKWKSDMIKPVKDAHPKP
jgi:hypothetical protein